MAKKHEKSKKDKKKKAGSVDAVEGKSAKSKNRGTKEKEAAPVKREKAGKTKKSDKVKEVEKELAAAFSETKCELDSGEEELTEEEWDNRHDGWDSTKVFDDAFLNQFGFEDVPAQNQDEAQENNQKDGPHCVHCGAPVFPGQAFCSRCGAYIGESHPGEHGQHPSHTNAFIKASIIGILAFCVLAIVVALLPPGHDLQPMYDKYCNEEFATISEGGTQLMIDTNPSNEMNFYNQDAFEAIEKVNEEIGLPAEVISEMKNTSGGEGTQRVSVHDVEVMWSYHPERGLEVVYTVIN